LKQQTLRSQLTRSISAVIVLPVLLMVLIASQVATTRLSNTITKIDHTQSMHLSRVIQHHWRTAGWQSAQQQLSLFIAPIKRSNEENSDWLNGVSFLSDNHQYRGLLLDASDNLLFDSEQFNGENGQQKSEDASTLTQSQLNRRVPITDRHGQKLGSLLLVRHLAAREHSQHEFMFSLLRLLMVSLTSGLIVALLISVWLAKRLSQPMLALAQASNLMATGKPAPPLPAHSTLEISQCMQAFNQMQHSISEQKQLRLRMMADISHEIRTPVSVMKIEHESWEDGLSSADQALTRIHNNRQQVERLIQDLRLLSLSEAHELEITLGEFSLRHFLQGITEQWQNTASKKGVVLQLETQISEERVVNCDSLRLAQVLNNLIKNALQHTHDSVVLRCMNNGKNALIEVIDNGQGIPLEKQQHLFERFIRGKNSLSNDQSTGLGLAISKAIMPLINGGLDMRYSDSTGTCFVVTITEGRLY